MRWPRPATVPDGPLVVGLTSGGQVLLYKQGSMSGKPKELEATLARDDIAAIEVEPGKVVKTITVAFADGTGVSMRTLQRRWYQAQHALGVALRGELPAQDV